MEDVKGHNCVQQGKYTGRETVTEEGDFSEPRQGWNKGTVANVSLSNIALLLLVVTLHII